MVGVSISIVGALIQNLFRGDTANFGMDVHKAGMVVFLVGVILVLAGIILRRFRTKVDFQILVEERAIFAQPFLKRNCLFIQSIEELEKLCEEMSSKDRDEIFTLHLSKLDVNSSTIPLILGFPFLVMLDIQDCKINFEALEGIEELEELRYFRLRDAIGAKEMKVLRCFFPELVITTGQQRLYVVEHESGIDAARYLSRQPKDAPIELPREADCMYRVFAPRTHPNTIFVEVIR